MTKASGKWKKYLVEGKFKIKICFKLFKKYIF